MSSKNAPDAPESAHASHHPARPWSLAARLTAWYAGSAFLLICLATSFLYWAMLSNVNWEDDELLADKVRVVETILQRRPGDVAAIRQEVEDQWDARKNEKTYVRILDESGRMLVESPGLRDLLSSTSFPTPSEQPGQGTDVYSTDGYVFRVVAVHRAGSPCIIQLAMDRSLEVEILTDYRKHLSYVLGVALLACVITGYLIAHRGVRPIHDIAKTARRIRPTNLSERLQSGGLPAELLVLAATFNDMLDRLEQSFARLSRFSADIAHELRTPLYSLRCEVEVTLRKPRTLEEYCEALGSSLEECGRLERLIDRLLFLARAESPETEIARELCEVGQELAAVREFYEPAATEAGVQLTIISDKCMQAELDRSLFQRAVGNLVANAIDHTPPGGHIILTAREGEASTKVEVADTGCGIPEADLPHIFDRLYRVDRSRTSKHGSVGLGLAIVRSIVELHNGSIEITSDIGEGTRVTMGFPRNNGWCGPSTPITLRR